MPSGAPWICQIWNTRTKEHPPSQEGYRVSSGPLRPFGPSIIMASFHRFAHKENSRPSDTMRQGWRPASCRVLSTPFSATVWPTPRPCSGYCGTEPAFCSGQIDRLMSWLLFMWAGGDWCVVRYSRDYGSAGFFNRKETMRTKGFCKAFQNVGKTITMYFFMKPWAHAFSTGLPVSSGSVLFYLGTFYFNPGKPKKRKIKKTSCSQNLF